MLCDQGGPGGIRAEQCAVMYRFPIFVLCPSSWAVYGDERWKEGRPCASGYVGIQLSWRSRRDSVKPVQPTDTLHPYVAVNIRALLALCYGASDCPIRPTSCKFDEAIRRVATVLCPWEDASSISGANPPSGRIAWLGRCGGASAQEFPWWGKLPGVQCPPTPSVPPQQASGLRTPVCGGGGRVGNERTSLMHLTAQNSEEEASCCMGVQRLVRPGEARHKGLWRRLLGSA